MCCWSRRTPALASATTAQAAGLVGQVRSSTDRVRLAMDSVATFRRLQQHAGRDAELAPGRQPADRARPTRASRSSNACSRPPAAPGSRSSCSTVRRQRRAGRASCTAPGQGDPLVPERRLPAALRSRDGLSRARARGRRALRDRRPGDRHRARAAAPSPAVETDAGPGALRQRRSTPPAPMPGTSRGWPASSCRSCRCATNTSSPCRSRGLRPDLPTFRVPDATLYGRPDVNALLLGGWEPAALSCDPRELRARAASRRRSSPTGRCSPISPSCWRRSTRRCASAGIRHVFRGWPTFTPDGRFIVGASRRVPGLVMAVGCNAHGVSGSAGIGRHVVEALLEPKPSAYVRASAPTASPRRAGAGTRRAARRRRSTRRYYHIGH